MRRKNRFRTSEDVPDDYRQKITQDYDLRIHPDDLLSIMVNSKDPRTGTDVQSADGKLSIANSNTGYAGGQNPVLGVSGGQRGKYRLSAVGSYQSTGE